LHPKEQYLDAITQTNIDDLYSSDKALQNAAYSYLMDTTSRPVDWAYDVWDKLVESLRHKDNHVRAIAAQVLCNLAVSDPEKRILKDFNALLAVTKDERFVTARHCLQALWKIGLAGQEQKLLVVKGLSKRFEECMVEKNGTLIRADIIQDLKNLYDALEDESIQVQAAALIETETDGKYRKKYATVWKARRSKS
jgi:hypothetical protein